jgi:hypothetical protein
MKQNFFPVFIMLCILILLAGCTSTTSPGPGPNTSPPITTPSEIPSYTPANLTECTNDTDCVPAQCCHPGSCINREFKGVCTVLCTQVCQGPIDCGAGHCGCVNGHCSVIPATPAAYGRDIFPLDFHTILKSEAS